MAKLSQIGERKIIEIFAKEFNSNRCRNAVVGIGDDACVVKFGDDNYLVASTDVISQKEHIPREMTPKQIGKYVVNVNLSDIASMGAEPLGLLFSFGLPENLDEGFIKEVARGINEACREHGTCVLGGDTKRHSEITISGTALGKVKKGNFLTRSGATVGDIICVTGKVGSAAAGFYCIVNNLKKERFIKSALEPRARVKEGVILAKYASSCMDISDGLAFTINEIAKVSRAGFLIFENKVPVDKALKEISKATGASEREIVFHKGGDYELLFTMNPKKFENLKKKMKKTGTKITEIGRITQKGNFILTRGGKKSKLESLGYESFITKF